MILRTLTTGIILLALARGAAAQDVDLSWRDLDGLTPAQIGDRALAGLDHEEIVAIEVNRAALTAQGEHRVLLHELPKRLGEVGCVRTVWDVTLLDAPDVSERHRQMALAGRRSAKRVAYSPDRPCLFADFVRVSGISPEQAMAGLAHLAEWRSQERALECGDTSGSDICTRPQAAISMARQTAPLVIGREGAEWWYALRPGTRLRLADDLTAPARLELRIPVPF
ncbi:hypothetical protein [Aurantiacibacter luteus]|nr:hypothetical protein [Aurantiacibacter luteus]